VRAWATALGSPEKAGRKSLSFPGKGGRGGSNAPEVFRKTPDYRLGGPAERLLTKESPGVGGEEKDSDRVNPCQGSLEPEKDFTG